MQARNVRRGVVRNSIMGRCWGGEEHWNAGAVANKKQQGVPKIGPAPKHQ